MLCVDSIHLYRITRIKCCCWLVSISSSSMFPSSPHTSALAGAGRAARTLDAALCNCPRRSHIHPQGLCHPSWCLCWSSLSSVKHACITVLLISSAAAAVLLSSAPMFLVRAGPGMSGVGSAAPGLDAALCNCHCVPNITTSALTRVAGARPGMAGSETSHIYNSLVLPA